MTSLYFPIASCAGSDHPDAAAYDRRWLVVDAADRWLTQKQNPDLARITVSPKLGFLVIRAPGMLRMDIPLDVIEDDDSVRRHVYIGGQRADVIDEGDLAATWMTNFLHAPCRLVKLHPDAPAVSWPQP